LNRGLNPRLRINAFQDQAAQYLDIAKRGEFLSPRVENCDRWIAELKLLAQQ
jgi:hypothetical protein